MSSNPSPSPASRTPRRGATLVAALLLAAVLATPQALADALLDHARHERQSLAKRIPKERAKLRRLERRLADFVGSGLPRVSSLMRTARIRGYPLPFRSDPVAAERRFASRRRALRRDIKRQRRLVGQLSRRRGRLTSTIDSLTPLKTCPVRGPVRISNDFGAPRYVEGKFDHWHRGNDMGAPYGTPIVAPFDGTAVAVSDPLGGLGVKVFGPRGYVVNLHLSAFGSLGRVKQGTVVGYVGMTGNATSPHDHFQWHPGGGAPVDPFVYLMRVCA